MLIIIEPRGETSIRLLGVPPFPERLMPSFEAASLGGGIDEVGQFLTDYQTICGHKGIARARATGEDRIHAKRLLARYSPDMLLKMADIFLGSEWAEPLRGRYFHHMRLFAHYVPQLVKEAENTSYG